PPQGGGRLEGHIHRRPDKVDRGVLGQPDPAPPVEEEVAAPWGHQNLAGLQGITRLGLPDGQKGGAVEALGQGPGEGGRHVLDEDGCPRHGRLDLAEKAFDGGRAARRGADDHQRQPRSHSHPISRPPEVIWIRPSLRSKRRLRPRLPPTSRPPKGISRRRSSAWTATTFRRPTLRVSEWAKSRAPPTILAWSRRLSPPRATTSWTSRSTPVLA